MIRIARIWSRLFGIQAVLVYNRTDEVIYGNDNDTVWAFHWRGVLYCWALWHGGKHDPVWSLARYSFPLSSVEYWTRERVR